MEINGGANRKCYEAVSPQHHPAVHTFQTVTGEKKQALFLEVQKKSEAGNFWNSTRETLQWLCCGTDR